MNDIHKPEPGQINEGRRRLAKGSLAAPVVLATFASKHALADPAYRCTISGQLSNNFSPVGHGSATDPCSFPLTPDTLKSTPIEWGSADKTKVFNDYFDKSAYFIDSGNKLTSITTSSKSTLEEVITLDPFSSTQPKKLDLGRWCIVGIVNALKHGSDYPLTVDQIKKMFQDTFAANGIYTHGTDIKMNSDEVISYFKFLAGLIDAPVIDKS